MTPDNSDIDRGHSGRTGVDLPAEGRGLLWHNLTDFYCNFFDLIEAVAILVDTTGTIRMFNRKAERLTGYAKAESLGQDCFTLLLPPHQRTDARELFMRGLKGGYAQPAMSMSITTRSGVVIPLIWSISVVRDDDGAVFGLVGIGSMPAGGTTTTGTAAAAASIYTYVEGMTHDLLNHSQVAMGYLELAIEQAEDDTDLKCMLNRAFTALKKCGDIAINVHKLSAVPETGDFAVLAGARKEKRD